MMKLSPLNKRRLQIFRANKRAWWSLWMFVALFAISLLAEVVANDKPALVRYDGEWYFPAFTRYAETTFGGQLLSEADYKDPYVVDLIDKKGWMLMAPIPFSYDTVHYLSPVPHPAPPSHANWLGTDDHGRDVVARVIYGFRVSVLFGFILTILTSVAGVLAGAVQGYVGGKLDLVLQRFIEIWTSMPLLYMLMITSTMIAPSFWVLLGMMFLFGWPALVGVVRAEFLRARNFEYVRAAKALGVRDRTVMFRHVLPNAMVAMLTILPFVLAGSLTTLTSLDFIGFGLPAGSPSLGELLSQGKNNMAAWWLWSTGFVIIGLMLTLVVFVGEGVRDAFDPRRSVS